VVAFHKTSSPVSEEGGDTTAIRVSDGKTWRTVFAQAACHNGTGYRKAKELGCLKRSIRVSENDIKAAPVHAAWPHQGNSQIRRAIPIEIRRGDAGRSCQGNC
jgi:hypothetical protein